MIVSIEEAKLYLRLDDSYEDSLVENLILSAEQIVSDVARSELTVKKPVYRVAILYTIAYLYENREQANHNNLMLTLRALLFGVREAMF